MTAKKSKIGASIQGACPACGADQPHSVEGLKKDGSAGQVRCETCSDSHPFKKPQAELAAKAARKAASPATATKRRKKGDAAISEGEAGRAKPYAMDGEFGQGEVIDHPRFGLGRVTTVRPGGKMDVSFDAAGPKLLACKDVGGLALRRRGARVVVPEVPVEVVVADEPEAAAADAAEDE